MKAYQTSAALQLNPFLKLNMINNWATITETNYNQ